MKKTARVLTVVMALVAAFTVTGCGGGGTDNPNELKIFSNDTAVEILLNESLLRAFEAKIEASEGIDFTYNIQAIADADYSRTIMQASSSGILPDVIYVADTNVEGLAQRGVFENLDPYYTSANFDFSAYDEAAFEIARTCGADGKTGAYFAPRTYDQPVILVNNTLWKQYMGEDVPLPTADESWTWTKLVGCLEQLQTAMNEQLGTEATLHYPLDMQKSWSAIYDAFVRSFGGYIYDATTDKFGLTDENTKKAMTKLSELVKANLITDVSGGSYFRSKKAVMYVASRSMLSDSWIDDYDITDVVALPIPIYDDAFTGQTNGISYYSYGSVGYAISAHSAKKDLAYKFVEFVLSEEGQNIIAATGKNVPVLKSLQADMQGTWAQSLVMLNGRDQSAFVFNDYKSSAYTRIPAAYARTGNVNKTYESTIYTDMKTIMDGLGKCNNVDEFCQDAQGVMERAIRG